MIIFRRINDAPNEKRRFLNYLKLLILIFKAKLQGGKKHFGKPCAQTLLLGRFSFLRPEILQAANHCLINATAQFSLFRSYNLNQMIHSSSDGQKFDTRIETVNARHSSVLPIDVVKTIKTFGINLFYIERRNLVLRIQFFLVSLRSRHQRFEVQ